MTKLYNKNPILFAILWIVLYVVGLSAADNLSLSLGMEKSVSLPVCMLMSAVLFVWIRKNSLQKAFGLCRSKIPAKDLLWYLPLIVMTSVNLWLGAVLNMSVTETVLYILSMLLVGFLEEIIFRGLLFKAMCRDNVKTAVIVSSVTFGIGHIVNLFNGSGADLLSNLLQVVYAIAAGFLFTILFYKTGSLLACIAAHSVLNALSVFANEGAQTVGFELFSAAALTVISLGYAWFILKKIKGESVC